MSGQQGEPTLVASFPPDCWVACVVETEPTLWCPIVEFGEPRRALGLARTGDWVWGLRRNGPDNLYRLGGPSLVGVLPILEVPLPMIREEARRAAETKGVSAVALLEALPSDEIIIASLTAPRSDYWATLGINWLEYQEPSNGIRVAVEAAAADLQLSQKTRHALLRWQV